MLIIKQPIDTVVDDYCYYDAAADDACSTGPSSCDRSDCRDLGAVRDNPLKIVNIIF